MKVRLVRWDCGDWIQLYVNGVLITEGHSIDEDVVARAIVGPDNVEVEWTANGVVDREVDYNA